jgi:hypothetical protein
MRARMNIESACVYTWPLDSPGVEPDIERDE